MRTIKSAIQIQAIIPPWKKPLNTVALITDFMSLFACFPTSWFNFFPYCSTWLIVWLRVFSQCLLPSSTSSRFPTVLNLSLVSFCSQIVLPLQSCAVDSVGTVNSTHPTAATTKETSSFSSAFITIDTTPFNILCPTSMCFDLGVENHRSTACSFSLWAMEGNVGLRLNFVSNVAHLTAQRVFLHY